MRILGHKLNANTCSGGKEGREKGFYESERRKPLAAS